MWISQKEYLAMKTEIAQLEEQVNNQQQKINGLEDDSGEALINRLTNLAKLAKIDVHSEEYQTMMNRVFLDIGGRASPVLKAYSGTSFMKDNPEEIIERLNEFKKQASVITRKLEDKRKKK